MQKSIDATDRECTNEDCDRVETRFQTEYNYCPYCGEELLTDDQAEQDEADE